MSNAVNVTKQSVPGAGLHAGNGTVGTAEQALTPIAWQVKIRVSVKAGKSNSGTLHLGTQGDSVNGFVFLNAGEQIDLYVEDTSLIFITGSASSQAYSWISAKRICQCGAPSAPTLLAPLLRGPLLTGFGSGAPSPPPPAPNPFSMVISGLALTYSAQGSHNKYSFIYMLFRLGEMAHEEDATNWSSTSSDAFDEVLYRLANLTSDVSSTYAYQEVQGLFASVGH